ncbi:ArsR/SmtB family transcription factor [Gehongia tenuis]|uniref:Winged helix-turn-helix transcriptional regulator n=1 Tax=Gehongia tenuis TaxID=2763655 RepID=A0A926HQ50_9FIRM|nr:metalloregulator ArsR/SmtB family transcription factor [Gehongia tenuis]MBC8531380.1 winged helix-turn-helix transcriptional regulator [Gehongia tenuis]
MVGHEHCESQLPPEEQIYRIENFFKVLGDATRLKILLLLLQGEMCVQHLAERLNMSVSAVSHQLNVLRQGRWITFRRQGRFVFYSFADDHIEEIISQAVKHLEEE